MDIRDIQKLCVGDEVFWTDPDNGLCSRHYTIQTLNIVGPIIQITDKDGSELECYSHELS